MSLQYSQIKPMKVEKFNVGNNVTVHVGAQGLSPGDNLKILLRHLALFLCAVFEPLDRQKDE